MDTLYYKSCEFERNDRCIVNFIFPCCFSFFPVFFLSLILARDNMCQCGDPCGSYGVNCIPLANDQFYCTCADGNFAVNEACSGEQKF